MPLDDGTGGRTPPQLPSRSVALDTKNIKNGLLVWRVLEFIVRMLLVYSELNGAGMGLKSICGCTRGAVPVLLFVKLRIGAMNASQGQKPC